MSAVQEQIAVPLFFSDSAVAKVKELVEEEGNPDLRLRVFVTGGGCSGFQYGFSFDDSQQEDDTAIERDGVTLLVDPMSYQYLVGATIDYQEGLQGSQFVVQNPNARLPVAVALPSLSRHSLSVASARSGQERTGVAASWPPLQPQFTPDRSRPEFVRHWHL